MRLRQGRAWKGIAASVAWAALVVVTVCVLRPVVGNAGGVAFAEREPRGRAEFGIALAIGDFDGDQRPDLATVSVDQANAHSTDYLIRLKFSEAPEATIGLTARGGGLDLSPRDVNGDEILDLVVSTAMDSRVVAVLVNDGHGNFSLAEPGAFAVPAQNASEFFHERDGAIPDLTALESSRSAFGDEAEVRSAGLGIFGGEAVALATKKSALDAEFCRYLGRSPPR